MKNCVSTYLREEPKLLKREGDAAGARIGTRVAVVVEIEIDDADDDCAAVVKKPFRSLAARALAAKRDDIVERRREVKQPPVELVVLDAEGARIERRKREKEEEASLFCFSFFSPSPQVWKRKKCGFIQNFSKESKILRSRSEKK